MKGISKEFDDGLIAIAKDRPKWRQQAQFVTKISSPRGGGLRKQRKAMSAQYSQRL